MNIIIKKQKLENPGIDPGASRMQIESSTTWANPPCALILFTNLFIISSWVAISNEYNYKETGIGEFGIDPGDSRIQIERSTTWANPLVHCFYWPIFSLFPRELQLAMNIIRKKGKLENPGIDPGASGIQIERSTTLTNPRFALNLFTNIFVISSWVAISNEYIYKETNITLVYWFYWPIFSLFPRALHLKMNIIIKKQKLENPGIDPGASRMQIERCTIWANPPCALILFTNLFLISSCVAIRNEYNYKETEIGESGYRSRFLSNANRGLYHLS